MPSREYFVGDRYDPKLLAYEQYIFEVIVLLGANPTIAMAEANMLVNFEIELAKVRFAKVRCTLVNIFGSCKLYDYKFSSGL